MVILIAGASHTGKTALAQRLLERHRVPYLSIDHLKMGLIRSGATDLTPEDDDALTEYLWPIVREIVKTVIENRQHLVVEGCYIPFGWETDFDESYLCDIRYRCLVMSGRYLSEHAADIAAHANDVERRLDGDGCLDMEELVADNARNLQLCQEHGYPYVLIDETYEVDAGLNLDEAFEAR